MKKINDCGNCSYACCNNWNTFSIKSTIGDEVTEFLGEEGIEKTLNLQEVKQGEYGL